MDWLFQDTNGLYEKIRFAATTSAESTDFFRQSLTSYICIAHAKKAEIVFESNDEDMLQYEAEIFPEFGIQHDYTLMPFSIHQYNADIHYHTKALEFASRTDTLNVKELNNYLLEGINPGKFMPGLHGLNDDPENYSPNNNLMHEMAMQQDDLFQGMTIEGTVVNNAMLNIFNLLRTSQYAQCTKKQRLWLLNQAQSIHMTINDAVCVLSQARPKAQDLPDAMAHVTHQLIREARAIGKPTNAHSLLIWKRTEEAFEELQASILYARDKPKSGIDNFMPNFLMNAKRWKGSEKLSSAQKAYIDAHMNDLLLAKSGDTTMNAAELREEIAQNNKPIYPA